METEMLLMAACSSDQIGGYLIRAQIQRSGAQRLVVMGNILRHGCKLPCHRDASLRASGRQQTAVHSPRMNMKASRAGRTLGAEKL